MTLRFEPFRIDHAFDFEVQPQHQWLVPLLGEYKGDLKAIMERPYSWTARGEDDRVIACCGVMENGYAWALLGPDLFWNMLPITKKVREVLSNHLESEGPVYADVDPMFAPAVRWARLLDFRQEGDRLWVFDANSV